MEEHSLNPLSQGRVGRRFLVQQLRGGKDFVSRMTALGFTEGVEVRVIQNYGHGPLIVMVREARVALGRGEALKVLVEEVSHEQDPSHY